MKLFGQLGWLLYQLAMAGGLLLAAPFLLARRGSHYLTTLRGRLGLEGGERLRGALWIHAVSVGEVAVAATLARRLPETLPLVVTTVTPTGQRRARETFTSGAFAERRVAVAYLPFDLGFAVGRFLRHFQPAALILVEGDYWPLVLRGARRRRIPVMVVNGRVGARSLARMRRIRSLSRRLFFAAVDVFAMQTEEDRGRLIEAGAAADRVHATGNLKYDSPPPAPKPELEATVHRLATGRPVLIAGSTMEGEEEHVLAAFRELGAGRRALLVLVPRHPERWDAAERLVERAGLACLRRSTLSETSRADDVLLLDSLGELAALYRIADVAFIGGTLVPTGGHNPLEPAHFAIPTVVGPSMENFRDMAERFEQARAWRQVGDATALAATWREWLADPQAARAAGERAAVLLAANRGAVERTLELLRPLLEVTSLADAGTPS